MIEILIQNPVNLIEDTFCIMRKRNNILFIIKLNYV
jgi:hypothetical protein